MRIRAVKADRCLAREAGLPTTIQRERPDGMRQCERIPTPRIKTTPAPNAYRPSVDTVFSPTSANDTDWDANILFVPMLETNPPH